MEEDGSAPSGQGQAGAQRGDSAQKGPKPFDPTPLENDGTIDLVAMASDHPEIQRFCRSLSSQLDDVAKLLATCAPWLAAPDKTPAKDGLAAEKNTKIALSIMQKDIEALDNMDLDDLEPGWGDRQTVRLARKQVINFAQDLEERLESLQKWLTPHVEEWKARAPAEIAAERELAAAEAARIASEKPRQVPKVQKAGNGLVGRGIAAPLPRPVAEASADTKRRRVASDVDSAPTQKSVAERVERLRARTGQEVDRMRAWGEWVEEMDVLAADPKLLQDPGQCKKVIEALIACLTLGSYAILKRKVVPATLLRGLDSAAEDLEALQSPEELMSLMERVKNILQML